MTGMEDDGSCERLLPIFFLAPRNGIDEEIEEEKEEARLGEWGRRMVNAIPKYII